MPVKQFIRHIPLVIQIADRRGGEPQERHALIQIEEPPDTLPPGRCPAPMKFVKDDVVWPDRPHLRIRHVHETCIGDKVHIPRPISPARARKILKLCGKYVFRRRQPADLFIRVILA